MTTGEKEEPIIETPIPDPSFILETPMKWEIVEKDLQKHFNTDAKFGVNKSAQKFGVNQGYVSKIALVDFDWTKDQERLPKKGIIKITDVSGLRDMCELVLQKKFEDVEKQAAEIHDNEMKIYLLMRDQWKCDRELRMPLFYSGRAFGEDGVKAGYIALEFIDGGIVRHVYHNVQLESCEDVFRILAKLGAKGLRDQKTVEEYKLEFIVQMFKDAFSVEKVRAGLPSLTKYAPNMEQHLDFISTKLEALADMDNYQKLLDESCPIKMLCHGDLWTANVIWEKDQNGLYRLKKLIDWQLPHAGSPVGDIVRFLNSALSGKVKHENRHRLIQLYYDTLVAECGDEVKVPFTVEMLNEGYEKLIPIVTIPVLPFFAGMIEMILKTVPEDEKQEAEEVFLDKLRTSIEEAVEYTRKWY
ncbi:unnamed protein product, partial [Mesorhabditis belari]|uniref:CHK kinase-like domain-containing protein n=1 Tax=Mesorhabditis belari TaxID=2138241 RepID=A0AAF3E9V7_9BILA